jgi:DNA polymerase alpha subunit A
MPQVQVALREITRGKSIRVNDVVSYIVTTGDESTKSLPAPKRSYTPQDVLKADSGLTPDIEYYLYKQIFPPIERLCAPIPGTDSVRLAECLGLDTRKYQITTTNHSNQQSSEIFPLESQIPDNIRFQDAARLTFRCRHCRTESVFEGLTDSTDMITPEGIRCSNGECNQLFSKWTLVAQMEAAIRQQTNTYYEGWLVCDDASCNHRTRQMSVYGHRCLGPQGRAEGCLGRMQYEYSEKRLYNQLLYFGGLWDMERAKHRVKSEKAYEGKKERVLVLASSEGFVGVCEDVGRVVEGYKRKCGRLWVDMGGLFGR